MAEKSLDDELKKAEIARRKAETAKLKAEEDLARKQLNAKWYAGKKLAATAASVLIVVALYGVFDRTFLAPVRKQNQTVEQARERLASLNIRLLDARIDSLNREKAIISATGDSLKIQLVIIKRFGRLDSTLNANVLEKWKMIKAKNYYDAYLNPEGAGIENKFELQRGDSVVYDAATRLTWQQSGSDSSMTLVEKKEAQNYIQILNYKKYAGYSDWRFPTLEEAMSLVKPTENKDRYLINPIFDKKQWWIWTADKESGWPKWVVNFREGYCRPYGYKPKLGYYVRAVRSGPRRWY